MGVLGWKIERLDEFEIRITAPDSEKWRFRWAPESDMFNSFLWRLAEALADSKAEPEFWRNAFMAMVNRTQSEQLTVTQEELDKARLTDNSMAIADGKYRVMAGSLRLPASWPDIGETVNRDMSEGFEVDGA